MNKKPNKIAVLMGGSGEEREVSLKSGKAINKALNENGYDVLNIVMDNRISGIIEKLSNVDMVF